MKKKIKKNKKKNRGREPRDIGIHTLTKWRVKMELPWVWSGREIRLESKRVEESQSLDQVWLSLQGQLWRRVKKFKRWLGWCTVYDTRSLYQSPRRLSSLSCIFSPSSVYDFSAPRADVMCLWHNAPPKIELVLFWVSRNLNWFESIALYNFFLCFEFVISNMDFFFN